MPYIMQNGWKAKDKHGNLKKPGEIIELDKKEIDRLTKLGAVKKVSVVPDEGDNQQSNAAGNKNKNKQGGGSANGEEGDGQGGNASDET